jgi:hypothetical protein
LENSFFIGTQKIKVNVKIGFFQSFKSIHFHQSFKDIHRVGNKSLCYRKTKKIGFFPSNLESCLLPHVSLGGAKTVNLIVLE